MNMEPRGQEMSFHKDTLMRKMGHKHCTMVNQKIHQ